MYNIIAIMGKSGAGKDSMMEAVLDRLPLDAKVHEIVSCTSRPMREGEEHGINYYYYRPDEFEQKIMNNEMLEFTRFNNWWYGTGYESVFEHGFVNIGVFNPTGIRQLLEREDCNVVIFWVRTADKTRLLRQLNREENPDVKEIIRRFGADEDDFDDIDFSYISIPNNSWDEFAEGVETIVRSVQPSLAQGQN